jgi:hypothetical protein
VPRMVQSLNATEYDITADRPDMIRNESGK